MNYLVKVPLNTTQVQHDCLVALQKLFSRVCNSIAPTVQQSRNWNRVTLHHLLYRKLRDSYPELGSQMVCNAIYSVSRASRLVFQHPASALKLSRDHSGPLPLLRFRDNCPVYFDRHTLSLKGRELSLFTLEGRMRFAMALQAKEQELFLSKKLRVIVLSQPTGEQFEIAFVFSDPDDLEKLDATASNNGDLPHYLTVEEPA